MGGSSPRMRGAPRAASRSRARPGIIPADAGSTCFRFQGISRIRDHPRGCGEHHILPCDFNPDQGSSPRMRGAQTGKYTVINIDRIIPADAGSTDVVRSTGSAVRGSSPRMRGAQNDDYGLNYLDRIIPADAGSTGLRTRPLCSWTDHPRGCGEHRKGLFLSV